MQNESQKHDLNMNYPFLRHRESFMLVVYMAHLVGSQSERRKFGLDQSESRISPM